MHRCVSSDAYKQVTVGGRAQSAGELDLRGGNPLIVEVTLSPDVARISGRAEAVKDHESEETEIVLVRDGEVSISKHATTEGNGKFTLEGVAPGEYRVFAIQGFDEDEWENPALLALLALRGASVELKEKEDRSLSLTTISSAEWDAAVAKAGGR